VSPIDAQALKGHLDSLLLAVVASGPAHGYAIIAQLRDRSSGAFDLPEGTVYPALHRLEANGLLRSSWERSEGRRRRVYAITPKGRRRLGAQRREWHGFSSAVEAVLA
jgi:DNA-binding PadR family transcriptional regulator